MAKKLRRFLSDILSGQRERYLVIEERAGRFDITRAAIDGEKKKISVLERETVPNLRAVRRFWRLPAKVIFAIDGRRAATVENVIGVRRSEPAAVITSEELEQLVFKSFWEFLNRYRPWAAKKLKTSDMDLVLSDIQVREVFLDHRRLFNPMGFDGREIAFRLRGTFVARSLLPALSRFHAWGAVAVVEGGSVLAAAIPGEEYWFALPNDEETLVYRCRDGESAFAGDAPWGLRSIAEAVRSEFFLDDRSFAELLRRYEAGDISKRLERIIDAVFSERLKTLGDEAAKIVDRGRPAGRSNVYFHLRLPIAPRPQWPKRLRGEMVRLDERLERENFTVEKSGKAADFSPVRDQETLALLSYSYDAPKYGLLNDILRRRARWLIPNL